MLACKYAVCVFEEIDEREFNLNVPLEYGFMRALNRQVLLLKDQRMPRLPADMTGKVYHPLDSYNTSETIGREINKWVEKDLGIGRIGEQAEILALMEHLPRTVVVLARFTEERKTFYEDILDNLRKHRYRPSLYDSVEVHGRGAAGSVSVARLARFVIADITDDENLTQEVMEMASYMPSVPVQPIFNAVKGEWEDFEYFRHYRSALERLRLHNRNILAPIRYEDQQELLSHLQERIITAAEKFIGGNENPPI